mgnify:CR=1 FL=1
MYMYMYTFTFSCGRIKKWYVITMLFSINDFFSVTDYTVNEHKWQAQSHT